jgi:ferrous iron transport protein B
MELPPYHLPTIKGLAIRTWDRLKAFTVRAGRVIVAVVVVISFLSSIGTDGSFGNQDTEASVLAAAGKALTPALAPMGITQDNWPATVGLLTGLLAKETVVGTLDALYGNLAAPPPSADAGAAAEAEPFDLGAAVLAAFATVPANLADLASAVTDPLGIGIVGEGADLEQAAEAQEVTTGTFTAMAERFDGQLGAFAYLLAVLLYMPCVAALAAIYRETGWRWAVFASLWTTGLGYGAAVVVFQAGRLGQDPATAGAWILTVLAIFIGLLALFRAASRREPPATQTAAA